MIGDPPLTLIVAASINGVIGVNGTLPWHLPDDLKRFKALTLGKPCIMGRKTWDSLPRKPLPGRTNIVLTRDSSFHAEGARVAPSFSDALAIAAAERPTEIMVIGGEAVFAEALTRAERILLTEIATAIEGDAFLPPFDRQAWREVGRDGPYAHNGLSYSYITLVRRH